MCETLYINQYIHVYSFSGLTGDGIQVIVGRHNLTSSSGKQYAVSVRMFLLFGKLKYTDYMYILHTCDVRIGDHISHTHQETIF